MFCYIDEIVKIKNKSVTVSFVKVSGEDITLVEPSELTIFSDKVYKYLESTIIDKVDKDNILKKVQEKFPDKLFELKNLDKGFKVVKVKSTKETIIIPRIKYDRLKHINLFGNHYVYYYENCLDFINNTKTNELSKSIQVEILKDLSESIDTNLLQDITVDLKKENKVIASFTMSFKLELSSLANGLIKGNFQDVYTSSEDIVHIKYNANLFYLSPEYKNKIKFNPINERLYVYKSNSIQFVQVLTNIIETLNENIEVDVW